MVRRLPVLLPILLVMLVVGSPAFDHRTTSAQLDPEIRDRVTASAMRIAIPLIQTEGNDQTWFTISLGSGTIVSADGFVLTNYHVVDPVTIAEIVATEQQQVASESPGATVERYKSDFVLLGSDGSSRPQPLYFAALVAEDKERDIAVLRLTSYADVERFGESVSTPVPYVVIGNSDEVFLGDRVQIFAYPGIAGGSLTYTVGAISGFEFDDSTGKRKWISTDAVMSGGSSGGTAINDDGLLIGIPTEGTRLDCRAGDTNRDGVIDEQDVGCIPTGGSLGRLIPINDAVALLKRNGIFVASDSRSAATQRIPTPIPTTVRGRPTQIPTATPLPTVTATPQPTGTSTPLPTRPPVAACSFAFDQPFDNPTSIPAFEEAERWAQVSDGALHLGIKSPGVTNLFIHDHCGTDGAAASFFIHIGHTAGWGQVVVLILTEDDAVWFFSVDPETETWSLYRRSSEMRQPIYWIEPTYYGGGLSTPLSSLGVIANQDSIRLLIDGRTITHTSDGLLPDITGSLRFGYGISIDPYRFSPSGQTFEASIERVILTDLR